MNDCAMRNFSKSLNHKNIDKSVSDIRIRFPFESSFWISVSGCKPTNLPDIQPANRIVIISVANISFSMQSNTFICGNSSKPFSIIHDWKVWLLDACDWLLAENDDTFEILTVECCASCTTDFCSRGYWRRDFLAG